MSGSGQLSASAQVPRVLVVDDDPGHARELLSTLADASIAVQLADSAPMALAEVAIDAYDLVLSDVDLPEVGGLELLRALEDVDPDLPVVLLSGAREAEAVAEAVRGRAFDVLWKPVPQPRLLAAIARGVELRRERAAREAERRRHERRSLLLSLLFERGSDGVLTWDPAGQLVDLSPSVARLAGHSVEALLARGSAELFEREPFGGAVEDHVRELALRPGEQQVVEVVVRTRFGTAPAKLVLQAYELPPASDECKPLRWVVGLFRPPRRAEFGDSLRRTDRLAAAARLAGGAAHEIKNDLGPLLACLSLLGGEGDDDPAMAELLTAVRDCVHRIEANVERILVPLRPRTPEPHARLDLREQVAHSVRFVRRTAGRRVPLHLELGEGLPTVRARPGDVHQIVSNLLLNALDACAEPLGSEPSSDPAGVWVRLWAEPERVVFEVEDSGPGIDPSLRTRVFEPFFTTKGEAGTGLGLPVVRELIRGLAGELSVVSRPELAGTRVRVAFPLKAAEQGSR